MPGIASGVRGLRGRASGSMGNAARSIGGYAKEHPYKTGLGLFGAGMTGRSISNRRMRRNEIRSGMARTSAQASSPYSFYTGNNTMYDYQGPVGRGGELDDDYFVRRNLR